MAGEKVLKLFFSDVLFKKIRVFTASTEAGLAATAVTFAHETDPSRLFGDVFPGARLIRNSMVNREADEAVNALLAGRSPRSIPKLDIRLTAFQWSVMEAISKIPYGRTRTYRMVAMEIGRPKAARAVGGALSRNPVPIIFPCHRVVASNGLGGFSGGLDIKAYLLDLEARSDSSEENL